MVETKNMKGWIFGDENQKSWTQKIFKQSNELQNPLHQNCKHVKYVKQIIETKNAVQTTSNVCQKCGSGMLEKEAKRGRVSTKSFWDVQTFLDMKIS